MRKAVLLILQSSSLFLPFFFFDINNASEELLNKIAVNSQSIRNQESTVQPDHRSSERKDLVQDIANRRGPEQNDPSSVLEQILCSFGGSAGAKRACTPHLRHFQ